MESTEHLNLNIPDYNNLADIEVLNGNFRIIDKNAKETKGEVDSKEPKIQVKKSGFNLDKTDVIEDNTNKLFTAKGALNLFNSLSNSIKALSDSIGAVSTNLSNHILKKVSISEDGHMAKEDKIKLDGVAVGANKYTLPEASELVMGGVNLFDRLDSVSNKGALTASMGKKLKDDAYKNEVFPNFIGDTNEHVDLLRDAGQYQCGANGGIYHLSYLDIKQMYPGHQRQIRHKWDDGIQWRNVYNTDFTGIPWNSVLDTKNINKLYCPIPIGFILMTDDNRLNPATLFPGTTWGRVAENRNIRGATPSDGLGIIGGSDIVGISQANLPNINLTAPDHTHTRGSMDITGQAGVVVAAGINGAFYSNGAYQSDAQSNPYNIDLHFAGFTASRTWSGATSGSSNRTIPLGGSGVALNVTNAFYKMHIWKRLT